MKAFVKAFVLSPKTNALTRLKGDFGKGNRDILKMSLLAASTRTRSFPPSMLTLLAEINERGGFM